MERLSVGHKYEEVFPSWSYLGHPQPGRSGGCGAGGATGHGDGLAGGRAGGQERGGWGFLFWGYLQRVVLLLRPEKASQLSWPKAQPVTEGWPGGRPRQGWDRRWLQRHVPKWGCWDRPCSSPTPLTTRLHAGSHKLPQFPPVRGVLMSPSASSVSLAKGAKTAAKEPGAAPKAASHPRLLGFLFPSLFKGV